MPFGNIWTCNQCGYSIRTSGVWEYYIDKNGNRKRCGHPGMSDEAKNFGVSGFTQEGYCVSHGIRDVVVVTFAVPQKSGSLGACLAYDDPKVEHIEFPAVCDKCGEKLKDDIEGELCPKCGKGKFTEEARFMS